MWRIAWRIIEIAMEKNRKLAIQNIGGMIGEIVEKMIDKWKEYWRKILDTENSREGEKRVSLSIMRMREIFSRQRKRNNKDSKVTSKILLKV